MSKKKYKHLSEVDRLRIYEMLCEGFSLQKIAMCVGYRKSTIYRDLFRNSTKLGYSPDFASQQYFLRRRYS